MGYKYFNQLQTALSSQPVSNDTAFKTIYIIENSNELSNYRSENICFRQVNFVKKFIILLSVITLIILCCMWLRSKYNSADRFQSSTLSWKTKTVSIKWKRITIRANNFLFHNVPVDLDGKYNFHSDPGNTNYTTLEITWFEHDIEMRINMYFYSDGKNWWCSELRVYNGQQNADWIYFKGRFFEQKLGHNFQNDVQFYDKDSRVGLKIEQLNLQAFI